MPNPIRSALLGLLLGAAASAVRGQAADPRMPMDEAGKLARYYESFAARTLARYYEETTFLVKAKVEMSQPAAMPDFEPGGAEPPPQLPGLPFLPEAADPVPPPEYAGGAGQDGPAAVSLDVLVDTSYSERDIEFIGNLLAMASHLDESRGDAIKVHEGVFPRDNRSLKTYRKPMEEEPAAVAARGDSARGAQPPPGTAAAADKAQANPFSAYTDHLPSLIPLLVICLLILACVWMVSRAIAGSPRREKAAAPLPAVPPAAPAQGAADPAGRADGRHAAPAPRPAGDSHGQNAELASYRPFLLNCFVGNPKHCVQIIRSWIQRDAEKGLRDTGALVASLDARLLGVLGPELGRDAAQRLEMQVQVGEALPPEELLTVYKEFKREFKNLSSESMDEDQHKDLFGFLHQMTEQQIMHILKDESMGIAGLVLAQLPAERSSAILQKVDPENRAKLLISMGNIDNIPLNVYKEIADRLSLKALDVGNMRYVAADGVDSILELIDNLPLNLQFNYIHSISEMDLGLAEKIRNRYVTLPEVAGLPDRFLASILQHLDQETLISALLHADDALRRKVLGLLPERMQMMVASGLEGASDTPPKASEAAQRKILHRIRDEIRLSGRPA
jgi:flagellar motor switch protein FliG